MNARLLRGCFAIRAPNSLALSCCRVFRGALASCCRHSLAVLWRRGQKSKPGWPSRLAWLAPAPVPSGGSTERLKRCHSPSHRRGKASTSSLPRLTGLDGAAFGAHSLRSGFLTSAARRGASIFKMRDVSRHKSMDVLQAYVRDADLFRDHAGAGLL